MKPIGSLLKVDPTAREVTNLHDLRGFRIKDDVDTEKLDSIALKDDDTMRDERQREYNQDNTHKGSIPRETTKQNVDVARNEDDSVDIETMERVRYKLIAASYSYWLSTPRETTLSGHPQDRDHIGIIPYLI